MDNLNKNLKLLLAKAYEKTLIDNCHKNTEELPLERFDKLVLRDFSKMCSKSIK